MHPDMLSLMQQLVTAVQSIALSVDVMSMDLRALNRNVSQLARKEMHRSMSPLTLAAECSYSQDDEASPQVAPATPAQPGVESKASYHSAEFPEDDEEGYHEKFDSIRETLREGIKREMISSGSSLGVDNIEPTTSRDMGEGSGWQHRNPAAIADESNGRCSDSKANIRDPEIEKNLDRGLNPNEGRFVSPERGIQFSPPGGSFTNTPVNLKEGRYPNPVFTPPAGKFPNPERGSCFPATEGKFSSPEKGIGTSPRYPTPQKQFEPILADARYPDQPKSSIGLLPPELPLRNPLIEKKGGMHKCVWCDREFSDSYKLRRHWRVHTGEKPFPCFQCGKSFAHKENLIVHGRIHSGERPFRCDVCGKAFAQKGRLTIHGRVHTGERPYSCDVCGKAYKDSWKLKTHRRQH